MSIEIRKKYVFIFENFYDSFKVALKTHRHYVAKGKGEILCLFVY